LEDLQSFAPTEQTSVTNLSFSLFSLPCCLLLHYWPLRNFISLQEYCSGNNLLNVRLIIGLKYTVNGVVYNS